MSTGLIVMLIIIFVLFVMQSIGGVIQIKDYQKTLKRVHKSGNLGIGQKKGNFFNAYLVMIACDNDGIITDAEILDGISILAKFHKFNQYLGRPLIGSSIYEFISLFNMMDKKQRKRNKGYIDAMQALSNLLNPPEKTEEEPAGLPGEEPAELPGEESLLLADSEAELPESSRTEDEKRIGAAGEGPAGGEDSFS